MTWLDPFHTNILDLWCPPEVDLGAFIIQLSRLGQIIKDNKISHSYANDTQIYLSRSLNDYVPLEPLCQCINQIKHKQNVLQLNKDKTEIILFGENEVRRRIASHLDAKGLRVKYIVKNLCCLN